MFPGRVLVIESHTFQRGVLAKALMSLRIEHVLSAGNAAQAEAYIQRRGVIDVVFLDLNDSSIDHRELLRIAGELGNVRTFGGVQRVATGALSSSYSSEDIVRYQIIRSAG